MSEEDEIYSLADLKPGDIGFGPIGGRVGPFIRAGQAILDGGAPYQHVYMVIKAIDGGAGPWAVEAMPSGARAYPITDRWTRAYCYVRPDYEHDTQAWSASETARNLIGTPYSFLDYVALTAHHLHLPVPHLDRYIKSSRHMICSQLVDYCLCEAGWHTFNDGRLPQDVTPSALYNELTRRKPRLTMAYPN